MTRKEAIAKAAIELGFWCDLDGTFVYVAKDGSQRESLHLTNGEDLQRAQSYIVYLLQKLDAFEEYKRDATKALGIPEKREASA